MTTTAESGAPRRTPWRRGARLLGHLAYAAGVPLRRALAAAGWPLTAADRRLAELRDRHRGRRGFVLGNGPSLAVADLDRLRGELTFASNKIYLAFDDTPWRPSYYSVVDLLVARNNAERIRDLDLVHVHGEHVRPVLGDDPRFLYVHHLPSIFSKPGWSGDLLAGACGGSTVIYLQLQLAFHLGIREVYLLGVDFSFDVPAGTVTGSETELGDKVIESRGEVNHFHPDYRKPGEVWTMPKLEEQRRAFRRARRAFEAAGGRLVNASRRTELDVLPRADLDRVLEGAG